MVKVKPTPAPASLNPAAATVAVRPTSSTEGKFLLQTAGASEWPVDEPKVKLPMWKKKDSFLAAFLNHKVVIAHCPTGSGKSTILPALAAMHLHPQAGRVCCTQIRRVTTQSVSRNTKDIWDIPRDSLVVGYRHGTEKLEHWNEQKTKVLFLTEGIVMRQAMSHDEHRHPETILPGCKVLMLDEAHSGSTDIELILARILPRISQVKNFRLVLMSATLNIDTFLRRVTDAGVNRSDVGVFHMDEKTNPLALYCVPSNLLRERDNMELALRMVIEIHHEYRNGYEGSSGSITGPILVFVPGRAEIRLLTELIKNAIKRGYTSGLYPYGFHADTPDRDRTFLTNGEDDPDPSRYGELQNYNKGRKANSFYAWLCDKRGYFNEYNLNPESKGDLLEVCFNLYYMHTILKIDLPQLFQIDDTYLSTWSLQWAMLQRDLHVLSMSGISEITDKHPNGPTFKKLARLETVCKYYSLISKVQVEETIQCLEGKRLHDSYTWMSCKCPYCGDHISKTKHWKTISQVTQAIWTHLETCDTTTNCQGLAPGLEPDVIKPFDEYPVLIEARMSKEGLLTFESILEESLVRCMESVMNSRVKWFESLVDDWGPDCDHANTGCQVKDHETGEWVPWVSTFNIPLLESIASGHFFDRSLAPVNEDIENVRRDNKRCLELLNQWKSKFPANYKNANLKMFKKGEGLTQEFLNRPRTAVLGPGRFERHPDLHPTAYKPTDPNDIRLILPAKGILPMGSAKGVVGYGMIHPNLINAAVLQTYGLSSLQGHFDAMSLAPNFDLSLTQQEAAEIAARIADWSTEEIDLDGQGELIVQTPFDPSKENMKHHRNFIDPTLRSIAQGISIAQVTSLMTMTDELSWLIPPMGAILQNQGTNTRALYYHLLQCKEDNSKEPQLNEGSGNHPGCH